MHRLAPYVHDQHGQSSETFFGGHWSLVEIPEFRFVKPGFGSDKIF